MWSAPYFPTTTAQHNATLFSAVFSDPHSQFVNKTFLDVLNDGGGPPSDVARHIVAALLNVAAGLTPVLTIPVVVGIWNEFISTGFYKPTAGVMWDHGQIVDYLVSTMPV